MAVSKTSIPRSIPPAQALLTSRVEEDPACINTPPQQRARHYGKCLYPSATVSYLLLGNKSFQNIGV